MSTELLSYGPVTWVNIEKTAPQDIDYLRQRYHFTPWTSKTA